jgi:hypothetical protein
MILTRRMIFRMIAALFGGVPLWRSLTLSSSTAILNTAVT